MVILIAVLVDINVITIGYDHAEYQKRCARSLARFVHISCHCLLMSRFTVSFARCNDRPVDWVSTALRCSCCR